MQHTPPDQPPAPNPDRADPDADPADIDWAAGEEDPGAGLDVPMSPAVPEDPAVPTPPDAQAHRPAG